ncbi:MAG TPA: non-ribosomal peptide synthetase, partial [Thiotrichaceae bacterium]|nr:non-ribosomal peptide synthetase [Thiotrichaceae bacterium]
VAQNPDNLAVVFEGEQLSYRQLNAKANQLAHHLQQIGVLPQSFVGLCVKRSADMVIGLLGILKTGAAYLPIDPDYPNARIAFMLKDAQASVILTHSSLTEKLPSTLNRLCLDTETFEQPSSPLARPTLSSEALAYVCYTSGSTGTPKGVCVRHQSVIRLVKNTAYVRLNPADRVAQASNIAFDAATFEIWGALLNGARLIGVPKEIALSPSEFMQHLQQTGINTLFLTTALFNQMARYAADGFATLKHLLFGGEAVDPQSVAKVLSAGAPQRLLHVYGPTENTTFSTWYPIDWVAQDATTIPIGQPLSNDRVYILDRQHQLVPCNVPGELCLAGDGLAQGYLNRPELTGKKFVEVVLFGKRERIYKTGDLARWLPDGNLEYIGRIDNQIKLRGFRIELGEIEAVLSQHEALKDATVILYQTDGDKRLVAYLTAIDNSLSIFEVRSWLKARLPDYMVPAHFQILESLPLTPNGKVDRKALEKQAEQENLVLKTAGFVAPRTPSEELLANIWADVLSIEQIGIQDNFFELGGHSLLATQMVSRIRDSFSVELPVRTLFEHPELSALAGAIAAASGSVKLPPIAVQAETETKVLSFAQQRLWFISQFEGRANATYNMPASFVLEGELNVAALQASLRWLVARHQSLRMSFHTHEGQAQVALLPVEAFECPLQDLSDLPTLEVQQRADAHAMTLFDLDQGPLFKAELLRLEAQKYVLLLNMHHIISDGWSIGIFVKDWQQAYTAFAQEKQPALGDLRIQYTDYAAWQRAWLQGEILQQQIDFWAQQLAGAPELLELPTDFPRPKQQSFEGAHYAQRLSSELRDALHTLSQQQGVSLFMTLLAAFNVLLSRYTLQEDICVGTPIANRTHSHTEELIGFFVNTLVLRTQLDFKQSFTDLLKQSRKTCLDAYAYQDIPFEYLVEALKPIRSLSHSPLFQIMFGVQNTPQTVPHLPNVQVSMLPQAYPIAKTDLSLDIFEQEDGLVCVWEYATALFKASTIEGMAKHFEVLLEAIVQQPTMPLHALPLLTEQEKQQLIAWNTTQTDYSKEQTIVALFEQQVEQSPDNIAVVFEGEQLSYQELNAKANQLAHYLLAHPALIKTHNPLIAIGVQRSVDMLVGFLGILKAGGAYVPIDPNSPAERVAYLLKDCAASVLLTQSALQAQFPLTQAALICLDELVLSAQSALNPIRQCQPDDLAYLIYTSGSTGLPKGVMVEHHALSLHIQAMLQTYSVQPEDRVLQFASMGFDTALEQLLVAWLKGACSVLVKDNVMAAHDLVQLLQTQAVSIADLPPAYWQQMLELESLAEALPALHTLILGGEALPLDLARQTRERFPTLTCFNAYGPTEAVITPTLYRLPSRLDNESLYVSIGQPRANTQVFVLDKHDHVQPIGIAGELCIAGAGLARGYLNRPELEKFVEIQLFGEWQRVYKTGDLARWLSSGQLDYLGRIDNQVKLRGFRIELGEIEAVLLQHAVVKQAAVVLLETEDNKRLVAYISTDAAHDDLAAELNAYLKTQLPDYMVPAVIMVLDALPLTPNGKIDRQALPAPDTQPHSNVMPRNEVELKLLSLWQTVLNQPNLGIHDNFFDLGGHSLLAVRLINQIQQQFERRLPVSVLFQSPTIASLAEALHDTSLQWTNCVPIQMQGDELPVYLLPGSIGSVLYLQPLAAGLGDKQPIYALQTPGWHFETTPDSIEALAAYHLNQLRQQQKQGPYQLVGHSFGGRVAFEMASQLEQQGETVALLAILDTNAPDDNESTFMEETEYHWLFSLVMVFEILTGLDLQQSLKGLETLELEAAYAKVLKTLQQHQVIFTPEASIDELKAWINIYRVTSQAHSRYKISGQVRCPIHFFRASEHIAGFEFEDKREAWGWADCTLGGLHEQTISGTHFGMMTAPHVQTLAAQLLSVISE